MDLMIGFLGVLLGAAIPTGLFFLQKRRQSACLSEQEKHATIEIQKALRRAEDAEKLLVRQKEDEEIRFREEIEKAREGCRQEFSEMERRLIKKESTLDRRMEDFDNRVRAHEKQSAELKRDQKKIATEQERYQELVGQVQKELERRAQLSSEEAKLELKASLEGAARRESGELLKTIERQTRQSAEKKTQEILSTVIQRFAGEYVSEKTVSVVTLPSDDMKGRIIGREGRNIRAIESATGCDLIIDDTPEAVVVSTFNPVRRAVAKRALETLVTDGRIHPSRIEEVVRKTRKNIDNEIREKGEQVLFDLDIRGVHPELVKTLGQLQYRSSYTQNVLTHSQEVACFAGIMADELGLNSRIARRAGLLHDIGKAIDHEVKGGHAVIGGQMARKYKEQPLIVNAIAAHHFNEEPISVYAPLINAADALSAARPGARRELMESYVERLADIEKVAVAFDGVDKAYALQAGRELRVIVSYDRVNDEGAMMLARDVARKVEDELTYPGEIKVTVIREMRVTEVAR